MRLVMFDFDGTLTDSNSVDTECFVEAISRVLSLPSIDDDWSNYKHVTDSGIVIELIESQLGRQPCPGKVDRIKNRFVELLRDGILRNPESCRVIAGAVEMLAGLALKTEFAVALATGGLLQSAQLKRHAAGLDVKDAAIASADDSIERSEIMLLARNRARQRHSVTEFQSVVYVGDGIWDLRASQLLGIPFIGIASGAQAEKLKEYGATMLLPDFRDINRFYEMIGMAQQQSVNHSTVSRAISNLGVQPST